MMLRQVVAGLCVSTLVGAADLPVREIVLYKHGVGYFERSGQLARGETARLDFKAAEMNDVLKSLTLHGARVNGLRYDSSQPLASRLEDFPFRIDDENPSLAGFLNQLKGARVELRVGADRIAGTIVNARIVTGDDKRAERQELVLLVDSGELRTFDLGAVAGLSFPDAKLQEQLREYLRVVADARSKDKRSVYIDSTADSSGDVAASYMIPMPVWKSSYRLIFDEKAEATLEGWAIVDNTTTDDWSSVRLALVSGRPVSFISQLYEPRYRNRPTAELAEEASLAPTVYEGGVMDVGGIPGGLGGKIPAVAARQFSAPSAVPSAPAPMREMAAKPSSVAATTVGREVGELFEYRFASPVTVKRGESAMLPFLQQKVDTRKLLIYSDPNMQNPMNAAEIANNTGKTLDGGPMTVFDAGVYAGEALIETLKTGDKRLISYAADLGTRVATKYDSGEEVIREIHANRGTLRLRQAVEETRTYTVHNVDQKTKTLLVQHAARDGFNLLSPKATETTRTGYRFAIALKPGATERLAVVEERQVDNFVVVSNLAANDLFVYVRNKNLSEAGRKQLEQILAAKRQLADITSQLASTRTQITALERDQQRTRQYSEPQWSQWSKRAGSAIRAHSI
jgi:hypothetical protein